jgi:hypothetical protein
METYPIASLQERYNLSSKQSVYDRIKALSIEPVARGKISSDKLDKLDKLDKHLKTGGTDGVTTPSKATPVADLANLS